ncbi:hypothetical protein SRABI106_04291 [Rahnella aquatilis]|nr:hypothetical protein SRABI106_04291 [Rahnella aquatilis]
MPGTVFTKLERASAYRLAINLFFVAGFDEIRGIFSRKHRCIVRGKMPEKRSVRIIEAKLNGIVVQFFDAFHRMGKLQAVEIRIFFTVYSVVVIIRVDDALEAEHHIVSVHLARR